MSAHTQKETISSRASPLFGFQPRNLGHHLQTQTSEIQREIPTEPGGVQKHPEHFTWVFRSPEYGKKRGNIKVLSTSLKCQLSVCLPNAFFELEISKSSQTVSGLTQDTKIFYKNPQRIKANTEITTNLKVIHYVSSHQHSLSKQHPRKPHPGPKAGVRF